MNDKSTSEYFVGDLATAVKPALSEILQSLHDRSVWVIAIMQTSFNRLDVLKPAPLYKLQSITKRLIISTQPKIGVIRVRGSEEEQRHWIHFIRNTEPMQAEYYMTSNVIIKWEILCLKLHHLLLIGAIVTLLTGQYE